MTEALAGPHTAGVRRTSRARPDTTLGRAHVPMREAGRTPFLRLVERVNDAPGRTEPQDIRRM